MQVEYEPGYYIRIAFNIEGKQYVYITQRRPVENLVFRKLLHGIPHGYEPMDDLEAHRRSHTDFTSDDWQLYLLFTHFKHKIHFGQDYQSQRTLKDFLIDIGSVKHLNIPFPILNVLYAELLTKITRRRRAGLPDIPDTPFLEKIHHQTLLQRFQEPSAAVAK